MDFGMSWENTSQAERKAKYSLYWINGLYGPIILNNKMPHILCIFDAVQKFSNNAISLWDWGRAIEILEWGYKAEHYSYKEAVERAIKIAQLAQKTYSSWDEAMESFLWGHQFWSKDDPNDVHSGNYRRRMLYKEARNKLDSPYQLKWQMALDISYALEHPIEILR